MAVDITIAELASDLRIVGTADDPLPAAAQAELRRHRQTAIAIIEKRTSGAPVDVENSAASAMVGYLYDRPTAPQGSRFANVWINSGASSLLADWIIRPTATIGEFVETSEEEV